MDKKLISILATAVSLSMVLPGVSIGAELEIKQEGYLFKSELTETVSAETFIISPVSEPEIEPEITEKMKQESTVVLSPPVVTFTNPIVVYFPIDSPEIDPFWKSKMLSSLEDLKVPKNTPLIVTGYTCQKGPDAFNIWLSKERAKGVAELLKKEGYTIAKIEGKGASHLVSKNYHPMNRRVEVKALDN